MKTEGAVRIVVCGAGGKMGRRIIEIARLSGEFEVVGGVEAKDYKGEPPPCEIVDDLSRVVERCQVVIEFTSPEASAMHAKICGRIGKPMVIGTTGLGSLEMKEIETAGKSSPIFVSPNMSWGVKILTEASRMLAAKLGDGYDIEIVEKHHREKKDSPSGTALGIAEVICEAKGWSFPDVLKHGREGKVGARPASELGIHAVRGGTIVGEHEIIFAGKGERITVCHKVESRDCFAAGALKAAKFIIGRRPGRYTMRDMEQA
ncbi:MAG: 4-hydroxy-tetrahydrodipicolinate reductase [Candidatus Eisenbacteria bacterium]|nr:4-hydroxy-tetrahydrodipicolinate reductase [Candidatus Eisenbacteria bacterium]